MKPSAKNKGSRDDFKRQMGSETPKSTQASKIAESCCCSTPHFVPKSPAFSGFPCNLARTQVIPLLQISETSKGGVQWSFSEMLIASIARAISCCVSPIAELPCFPFLWAARSSGLGETQLSPAVLTVVWETVGQLEATAECHCHPALGIRR